jgi:ferredoxin
LKTAHSTICVYITTVKRVPIWARGRITWTYSNEQSLLEAMRAAGLDVASSCETGSCGTCRIAVKKGKIVHKGKGLTTTEQEKQMLCCVSRGQGHIVVELDI